MTYFVELISSTMGVTVMTRRVPSSQQTEGVKQMAKDLQDIARRAVQNGSQVVFGPDFGWPSGAVMAACFVKRPGWPLLLEESGMVIGTVSVSLMLQMQLGDESGEYELHSNDMP